MTWISVALEDPGLITGDVLSVGKKTQGTVTMPLDGTIVVFAAIRANIIFPATIRPKEKTSDNNL
jgi:hypothetical protein